MLLRRRSQKIDFLKKVPLFSNLSKSHLNAVAKIADQVTMNAGDVLARQGKLGGEFILIVEGKAQVEKDGEVIRHLSANDFFGEISLIDAGFRTATVTAETVMTLLVVHKVYFMHLLDTVPGLQKKMLFSLCKYLRTAEKDINM